MPWAWAYWTTVTIDKSYRLKTPSVGLSDGKAAVSRITLVVAIAKEGITSIIGHHRWDVCWRDLFILDTSVVCMVGRAGQNYLDWVTRSTMHQAFCYPKLRYQPRWGPAGVAKFSDDQALLFLHELRCDDVPLET